MLSCQSREDLERADGCLFLCSGNIIRSAFAELYATHLGWNLSVRSAGTTYSNTQIHPKARAALLQRGVSAGSIDRFRPQLLSDLTPEVREGEWIFAMKREHLALAKEQGARGPVFLLTSAIGQQNEIADPYFEGGWEEVFDSIAHCVEALVQTTAR